MAEVRCTLDHINQEPVSLALLQDLGQSHQTGGGYQY